MKTTDELNALKEEVETMNKKLHELTEEELGQISGGADKNIAFGYATISSLDGITTEDAPEGFILNGVKYTRAYMTSRDANGNIFEIYCGEGHMAIIPQG